jgi:guanylate kinase
MSGILFIISAPSGSGKSTLVNELRKYVPNLEFSVSYTTRAPRGSEQDGREYHFITRDQFEQMIREGAFLEHAEVFGHHYGTPKSVLDDAARRGNDLLLDIDVQGERQVKNKMPDGVSIFVLPPSRAEQESRLRKRGSSEHVSPEETQRRLAAAKKEIENYRNYDYIVINDRLEPAVDELQAVVLGERAERSGKLLFPQEKHYLEVKDKCRTGKMEHKIKRILDSF